MGISIKIFSTQVNGKVFWFAIVPALVSMLPVLIAENLVPNHRYYGAFGTVLLTIWLTTLIILSFCAKRKSSGVADNNNLNKTEVGRKKISVVFAIYSRLSFYPGIFLAVIGRIWDVTFYMAGKPHLSDVASAWFWIGIMICFSGILVGKAVKNK